MPETQIAIGDPDEEYELHKKEISLENPLGGTIIDGFNISQNRPEDHIRREVGLKEIGGTVEWRKLEKRKREEMKNKNEEMLKRQKKHEAINEEVNENSDQEMETMESQNEKQNLQMYN